MQVHPGQHPVGALGQVAAVAAQVLREPSHGRAAGVQEQQGGLGMVGDGGPDSGRSTRISSSGT